MFNKIDVCDNNFDGVRRLGTYALELRSLTNKFYSKNGVKGFRYLGFEYGRLLTNTAKSTPRMAHQVTLQKNSPRP